MLSRRTPMKRTAFKRKPVHQPNVERSEHPMARLHPLPKAPNYGGSTSPAKPKDKPVRSEAYRRLVAALPCARCQQPGPSQCAHANTGKGMGMKTDDRRSFPLCPTCHRLFDQAAVFAKEARRVLEDYWAERTRAAIIAAGQWLARLPLWEDA